MAIAWLFAKNKDIGLWLAFTVFYPAILIFWRIPVFLYKQESWILAFALINAIIYFSLDTIRIHRIISFSGFSSNNHYFIKQSVSMAGNGHDSGPALNSLCV